MSPSTKTTGDYGEELAAAYLRNAGYHIRHQNWRYKHKELDIVADKDNMLVIVEVKTRKNSEFEGPNEVVTKKQQRFIIEATNAYIDSYKLDMEVRLDVIYILYEGREKPRIEHIEEAFYPGV